MIACTPTVPPAILSGSTFVDCGRTWIFDGPGEIVAAPSSAQLRESLPAAWRVYCAARFPHSKRARRVCFTTHVGR
jgi:hypothetical protein